MLHALNTGDADMSLLDEVPGRHHCALVVVGGNVGDVLVIEVTVDADDGQTAVVKFLYALPVLAAGGDHEPFDIARLKLQQFLVFRVSVFVAVANDGDVTAVSYFSVYFAGDLREEGVAQRWNDEGDGVALS